MQIESNELTFNCFTSWSSAAQAAHPDATPADSEGQYVELTVDGDVVAGWDADTGEGWVTTGLENAVRMKASELVYFLATRPTGVVTQMAASGHMLMHKVQAVAAGVSGGPVRLKLLDTQPAGMVLVLDDAVVEAA